MEKRNSVKTRAVNPVKVGVNGVEIIKTRHIAKDSSMVI